MAWCPEEDIESKILEMYSDTYLTFEEYDQITPDETVSIGIADDAYCNPQFNSIEEISDKTGELCLAAMVSDLKISNPRRLATTNDLLNDLNSPSSIENEITSMLRNCGTNSYKTKRLKSKEKRNQIKEDDFIISNGLPILLNSDFFELKPRNECLQTEENVAATRCVEASTSANKAPKEKPLKEINNMKKQLSKIKYNSEKYTTPRQLYLIKRTQH